MSACVAERAQRRCGREAEGGGLLNRYRVVKPYRGFESLRLRQLFALKRLIFRRFCFAGRASGLLRLGLGWHAWLMRGSAGQRITRLDGRPRQHASAWTLLAERPLDGRRSGCLGNCRTFSRRCRAAHRGKASTKLASPRLARRGDWDSAWRYVSRRGRASRAQRWRLLPWFRRPRSC